MTETLEHILVLVQFMLKSDKMGGFLNKHFARTEGGSNKIPCGEWNGNLVQELWLCCSRGKADSKLYLNASLG